jgi:hypothetical protein
MHKFLSELVLGADPFEFELELGLGVGAVIPVFAEFVDHHSDGFSVPFQELLFGLGVAYFSVEEEIQYLVEFG